MYNKLFYTIFKHTMKERKIMQKYSFVFLFLADHDFLRMAKNQTNIIPSAEVLTQRLLVICTHNYTEMASNTLN